MQQYLPFTVLKHTSPIVLNDTIVVATVLTVYGIETESYTPTLKPVSVATVLTVYGIETAIEKTVGIPFMQLQQYLPFTVLKQEKYGEIPSDHYGCNSTYRLRY